MLDRQALRSEVVSIYKARENVLVEVWSMQDFTVVPPRPAGMAYIQTVKAKCTRAKGTPLQPGTKIAVSLTPGEVLYGLADSGVEGALLGLSIHPNPNMLNQIVAMGN